MKHILLIALFALLHSGVYGQGRNRKFLEVATHSRYQLGWYTLEDGTRHAGKLRMWQTLEQNSVQVDQGKADPINLLPEQLRCFTMGADSFIIARHVAVAGMPDIKPFSEVDIYRVVLKGRLQVFAHDCIIRGGHTNMPGAAGMPGMVMSNGPSHVRSWVLRPTSDANLVMMPYDKEAFAHHVAPFFVRDPILTQYIRAGMVDYHDFERIVYAYIFYKDINQVTYEQAAVLFR
ncbi:MAG TPA: hypothetical protein VF690_01460 [Hymenobacter sp.]|jgi:hypothetical protein